MKGLAVLGSTGSIGTQTLDVARAFPGDLRVVGLAARSSVRLLESQVREFRPRLAYCEATSREMAAILDAGAAQCSMVEMALDPEVDIVVTATVGDVALLPTIEALKAGKRVALANKESVIMAGPLLTRLAREHGGAILPVDSEPSAIWQCIQGDDQGISGLVITASGGAFRGWARSDLADVTPEQAVNHPTWSMGPKITVDSATLMNKAFEVIEAHYLFGIPWENISVVIHPQSIIHSMVEFVDGTTKAHLGQPDMRLPIQYALFHPERMRNDGIERFDPIKTGSLTFEEMEPDRYPCFDLAINYGRRGGTWPAALCGADEAAVDLFLSRRIGFLDIPAVIREALDGHCPVADPTAEQALEAARWADRAVRELAPART